MDEIEKEKWKKKAKEDRMKLRNDKASRIVAAASSPFPIASTHLFGQKSKTPRIQKGSVLQAREDEILATDVEKRRLKDRKSFENAFTWKYETDKSGKNLKWTKMTKFRSVFCLFFSIKTAKILFGIFEYFAQLSEQRMYASGNRLRRIYVGVGRYPIRMCSDKIIT